MQITEKFIKGKNVDESLCEDALYIGESFVAVVDGVTSKSDMSFGGKKGGRAAAEKVCEAIAHFPADISVEEAVEVMTQSVASLYPDNNFGAAAACVIIFSKAKNEIWCVGDCQCFINDDFFSHEKEIDAIVSDMRALVIEIGRRKGMSEEEIAANDIGRSFIMPVIKEQHLFANTQGRFSYGVINGSTVLKKDITVHKVSGGDEIVLASDGYPKLFKTLAQSEEYLREQIKSNPLCDGDYRSTKGISPNNLSFDDRTYVRFKV